MVDRVLAFCFYRPAACADKHARISHLTAKGISEAVPGDFRAVKSRAPRSHWKMSLEHSPARQRLRPRFRRIPAALAYGGISKSRLYEWARLRPDLIKKNGTAS